MRRSATGRCGIGPATRDLDLEDHTQFWQRYASLPAEIRRLADKAYVVWKDDPGHGSLHFKKLEGHEALWSVRVGRKYRALARRKGDLVVWVWIGHHSEYDRLIR